MSRYYLYLTPSGFHGVAESGSADHEACIKYLDDNNFLYLGLTTKETYDEFCSRLRNRTHHIWYRSLGII